MSVVEEALRVLGLSGPVVDTVEFRAALKDAWKATAKRTHPDGGGANSDSAEFVRAKNAHEVIQRVLRGESVEPDPEPEPDLGFDTDPEIAQVMAKLMAHLGHLTRMVRDLQQEFDAFREETRTDLDEVEESIGRVHTATSTAFKSVATSFQGIQQATSTAQETADEAIRIARAAAVRRDREAVAPVPVRIPMPQRQNDPIISQETMKRGVAVLTDVLDLGVKISGGRRRRR